MRTGAPYLRDEGADHLEQVLSHSQVEDSISALLLRCVDFCSALNQQAEAALAVPPHSQVERMETCREQVMLQLFL